MKCVCCGITAEDRGRCGHWFCHICFGRGHDDACVQCEEDEKDE